MRRFTSILTAGVLLTGSTGCICDFFPDQCLEELLAYNPNAFETGGGGGDSSLDTSNDSDDPQVSGDDEGPITVGVEDLDADTGALDTEDGAGADDDDFDDTEFEDFTDEDFFGEPTDDQQETEDADGAEDADDADDTDDADDADDADDTGDGSGDGSGDGGDDTPAEGEVLIDKVIIIGADQNKSTADGCEVFSTDPSKDILLTSCDFVFPFGAKFRLEVTANNPNSQPNVFFSSQEADFSQRSTFEVCGDEDSENGVIDQELLLLAGEGGDFFLAVSDQGAVAGEYRIKITVLPN